MRDKSMYTPTKKDWENELKRIIAERGVTDEWRISEITALLNLSDKVANKEEMCGEICPGPRGTISGHVCFNKKPCPIHSPSDKTWEERFDEDFGRESYYCCGGDFCSGHEEQPKEIKEFITKELTSATIKAKEEVLRYMKGLFVPGWEHKAINEYAKALGINLEEPSK